MILLLIPLPPICNIHCGARVRKNSGKRVAEGVIAALLLLASSNFYQFYPTTPDFMMTYPLLSKTTQENYIDANMSIMSDSS